MQELNKQNKRYLRQTTMSEIGETGQSKLLNAKLIIIGCGGLGGEVAVHLATAGIGKIELIDFDTIDITNLHRQVFFKEKDIGKAKAETLAKYLKQLNSDIDIHFETIKLSKENIKEKINAFDIVVDCTDDLLTKYLINDACVLENKILVYGSLHKFEGHIAVFNSKDKKGKRTANLRDLHPEIPTENIPNCSEVGTLNSIVSIIANMQVNEVFKLVLGIGKPLSNTLLIYNSLDNSQLKVKLKINKELNIATLWDSNTYDNKVTCNLENTNEVTATLFKTLLEDKSIRIISVLEEEPNFEFEVYKHFPFSCFDIDSIDLKDGNYIIICNYGNMSLACSFMLKKKFPSSTFRSLKDGIYNYLYL